MRPRGAAAAVLSTMLLASGAAPADDPQPPPRPKIEDSAGVPVTFTSEDRGMRVYIAHGEVPERAFPDPYEKLPQLPFTVRLAPGTYTVEAESQTASTSHEHIFVERDAPLTVRIRGGNAMVKTFGSVFIAAGVVSTILGIVAIVSISPHDQSFNRWAVGLPLTIGGVALAGLGVGMTALGSTTVDAPRLPPGGAPHGVAFAVSF
ncbi:MAG TPA: hypothetical protein VMI75_35360 [Polyangiaceae bacterium]|nr:hypothetical protein [Polyangiaceae bacterium]